MMITMSDAKVKTGEIWSFDAQLIYIFLLEVSLANPADNFANLFKMDNLIPVINQLQDIFKQTGGGADSIQLPEIVVVGSQSCGKSSVLESLVGHSFLPRGKGIVTRCPIIIQLNNLPATSDKQDRCHFVFGHNEGQEESLENMRELIEKRTNELVNFADRGISDTPIIIKVYSSKVIPLTVVDLPGIVKNAVGEQPQDIEQRVENLIEFRIRNPNAIILAISPANADIATSDSIKMASKYDPEKIRTIAVVTKLDMMDKGTNANDVLTGTVIPMPLGVIGVVNRSQKDIDENKSIDDALATEKSFLEEHYPFLKNTNGSVYLAKRLNELLMKHIKTSFPALKKRIDDLIELKEQAMRKLGDGIPTEKDEMISMLEDKINEFVHNFEKSIENRPSEDWLTTKPGQTPFAAQIALINSGFARKIRSIKITDDYSNFTSHIGHAIENSANVECFTSIENAFRVLARDQIRKLDEYCMEAALDIHKILVQLLNNGLSDKRLSKLTREIIKLSEKLLDEQLRLTKNSIKEYMVIQSGRVFSRDANFFKVLKSLKPRVQDSNAEQDDDDVVDRDIDVNNNDELDINTTGKKTCIPLPYKQMKTDCTAFPLGTIVDSISHRRVVAELIKTYCSSVQREIGNFIPKHNLHHLFDKTLEKLRHTIRMGTVTRVEELVCESDDIAAQRREITDMLLSLRKSKELIGDLEYNSTH